MDTRAHTELAIIKRLDQAQPPAQAGASLRLTGFWMASNLTHTDTDRGPRLRGDDILFRGDDTLYV